MITSNPIKIPFIDLTAQRQLIAQEIDAALAGVFRRNDYILGQDVMRFQEEFAAFCGVSYAIGVDSGTSALELALEAYRIGPGDEVITAANTFIATALAISHVGAIPVLVDVDPEYYTIDANQVEAAITARTRAIIPVHLYGQVVDMDPILALAERHHLVVIEDACQAHGAAYHGQRAGSLGHIAAFSFYPGKNLGAYGDGGMIVTNDPDIARRLDLLHNYGQTQKYFHAIPGYNRRLDTLQAAILRIKLKYLDQWNAARRRHAALYTELLTGSPIVTPHVAPYADPVWHLYVVRVAERDRVRDALSERGISTIIHYPIPIHLQEAYANLGHSRGAFPVTERLADEIISLPMFAEMTPDQITYVADAVKEVVAQVPV